MLPRADVDEPKVEPVEPCVGCGAPSACDIWERPVCDLCFSRWMRECEMPEGHSDMPGPGLEVMKGRYRKATDDFFNVQHTPRPKP